MQGQSWWYFFCRFFHRGLEVRRCTLSRRLHPRLRTRFHHHGIGRSSPQYRSSSCHHLVHLHLPLCTPEWDKHQMAQQSKAQGHSPCGPPCPCSMWCCRLVCNHHLECPNNHHWSCKEIQSYNHLVRPGCLLHTYQQHYWDRSCRDRSQSLCTHIRWRHYFRKSLHLDLHVTAPKRFSSCHPLPVGASIGSRPCCHTPGRIFLALWREHLGSTT